MKYIESSIESLCSELDMDAATAKAALQYLSEHPNLMRQTEHRGCEVLWDGLWRLLCRQDLFRQVCTLRPGWTPNDFLRLNTVQYGARITDDSFTVIDSLTDG